MGVTHDFSGPVALIRLYRPAKMNALWSRMLKDLRVMFTRVRRHAHVRAVILTGAGDRAFSAGTDIADLAEMGVKEARRASARGQKVCELIESCPVPVIAAVNGVAAGGGCELALACHLRVTSTNARFSLPELKLGLIPGYGGTQRLARATGTGRALEMMLAGAELSAEEALRVGLVNRVVAPEELMAEADALAQKIAGLAPLAVRACLEAVTRGFTLPLKKGLKLERELFSGLFATEDVREGTRAFFEKRAPAFKGK